MTKLLNRLNLRPMERRIVVGVFMLLFVFLNAWKVWPHFKDWNIAQANIKKGQQTLVLYTNESKMAAQYEAELKQMDAASMEVPASDMPRHLRLFIEKQAAQSGVIPNGINISARSAGLKKDQSEFFEEQTINMGIADTGEKELVEFLYSLGSGNSLVRVKDLNVKPTANMLKLQGSLTLVASYQKKSAPKSAPAKPASEPGAPKPAPKKS